MFLAFFCRRSDKNRSRIAATSTDITAFATTRRSYKPNQLKGDGNSSLPTAKTKESTLVITV
jgi:hypothetical protein